MQPSKLSRDSLVIYLYFAMLTFVFLSCGPKAEKDQGTTINSNPNQHDTPVPLDEDSDVITINEPEVSFSMESSTKEALETSSESKTEQTRDIESIHIEELVAKEPTSIKKDFNVVLSADSVMYLNQAGMMKIWIGEQDIDIQVSQGMSKDVKKMSSSIGQFAKITPIAPDFEILNHKAEICYKIDPSGSEVRYAMKPKDEGSYRVSADILLFDTEDCTGIAVPKSARELTVAVQVDMKKTISKNIHFLERELWKEFKIFWMALLALIFGAAIFVIRRFVKNKTGYEDPTQIQSNVKNISDVD